MGGFRSCLGEKVLVRLGFGSGEIEESRFGLCLEIELIGYSKLDVGGGGEEIKDDRFWFLVN